MLLYNLCIWHAVLGVNSCKELLEPAFVYFLSSSLYHPLWHSEQPCWPTFYLEYVRLLPTSCLYSGCSLYLEHISLAFDITGLFFLQVSVNLLLLLSPSKLSSSHQLFSYRPYYFFFYSNYLNLSYLFVYSTWILNSKKAGTISVLHIALSSGTKIVRDTCWA